MHKILSSEKLHCRPIRAVHEDFILFDPLEECNFRKWKLLLNWELMAEKRGLNRRHPTISGKFDCFCSRQCTASHLKDNGNPIKLNIYDFASLFLKQMTWYRNVSLCAIWLRDGTLLIKQFLSFFWSNFSKSNLLQKNMCNISSLCKIH